uniref:Ig-like domain-containing protein n=1 Tax=Megaselia scalaris TaxID=36166 RepID=T1GFM3_MEGSC
MEEAGEGRTPIGINCFQRFAEYPKYTEVNPGQDALLTCKVIDKRGTCSWQKDNKIQDTEYRNNVIIKGL